MRHMKPMSQLIALVILCIFFLGGYYMMMKPCVETHKTTVKIMETLKK